MPKISELSSLPSTASTDIFPVVSGATTYKTTRAQSAATTETLTNKTISLASNTVSGTKAEFDAACSDANFASLAGTETLTNKSINLSNNTLTGTTAEFNIALSDGSFATLDGTETLTNKTLTAPVVTQLNGGQLAGLRNVIINGGMAIDQRNSGASQTFTAGAALAYCVDRWYGYCTGANVTGQQVAGSGSSRYRYRFTGAASVTGIGFGQRIEVANSYFLNNSTATLSVDLANSLLTSVTWTAYYANTADTFGTLASPTRTQIATGTFTVNSTVTRYSTNISIPAAATTGIEIVFSVGAQTSGTWTVGDVQLELGTQTTPFERRSYGQDLVLCQRYYEIGYFKCQSLAQTYFSSSSQFCVLKRVAPTISWRDMAGNSNKFSNGSTDNLSVSAGGVSGNATTIVVDAVASVALTGGTWWGVQWAATAEL